VAQAPREWAGWSATRLRTEASNAERAGQVERAIALLEEAVRRAPEDSKSVRHLANLLTRVGRRQAATEQYRRLAQQYERDQLYGKAIAAWRIVLQSEPGFAGAHVKLGELYALEGLRADARKHYLEALARFRASGRQAEAARIAARIEELDRQSDPGLIRRGHTAARPLSVDAGAASPQAGEDSASRREETALEPQTADADAEFVSERLQEGRLFRRYGLLDQARSRLSELLARFPDHLEGRRELRDVLVEMGRHEEAAEQQRLLAALEGGGHDPVGDLEGIEVPVADEESRVAPAGEQMRVPLEIEPLELDPLDLEPLPPEDETTPADSPHLQIELDDALAPASSPGTADATPPEGEEGPQTGRELRDLVNGQVGRDDYETRYDLGIAYREMGLLDEAIAELQLASRGPGRLVECASLLAACFLEKGLPQLSVTWLERALAAPGLDPEAAMSLRYDLAGAFEAGGRDERALEIYVELYGEDAGFRDVAEKLRAPGGPTSNAAAGSGTVLPWRRKQ
jgi:tetratricopeptide (TPR) repeat protein